METIKNILEFIFSFALFINALLFLPQAAKIFREKTSKDVSLITFLGFLLIQFVIVLHGIVLHDYILTIGYLLSMAMCGSVVVLILIYKKPHFLQNKDNEAKHFEMLEHIIALMPGHVYWLNRENVYLGCNDNQANSAGLNSREEIIGKRNKDLPWNYNAGILPETLDKINTEVMETEKAIMVEEPALLHDGTRAVFLSNKVPLHDRSGKVIGIVGISFDITEQKRIKQELEETRHKLEGMTLIGSSIAHELRTPLRTIHSTASGIKDYLPRLIKGYQLASNANLPVPDVNPRHLKTLFEACETVESEAHAAFTIINMLLMNIKQDISTNDFKKCSIYHCIEEALQRYPFDTGEAALIHWDHKKEDFIFIGNELLVVHVIFNLLKNALYQIKGAGKGDIKVWTESDTNYYTLHFKDTAKGIPSDFLPHIFERFFSRTYHGAGVGLTFCKMVMENLGGQITCDSKEGEYTDFILFFPRESSFAHG